VRVRRVGRDQLGCVPQVLAVDRFADGRRCGN
jgi:hypothetical protein